MLLCSNQGFFEQHSIATAREKDEIRVQNVKTTGKRETQDEFIKSRPMGKYKTLKEEAYEANMQLPELGLVLFTFGNASSVDRAEGVFAIKPSGVPYAELKVNDMVICDYEANVVEGKMRPSSDTKTHAVLYREWANIGGVVHTHSTYGTAMCSSTLSSMNSPSASC